MSTFEEKSNPYEILIRFDEKTGDLKGAHQQRINVVMKDGEVIQSTIGDAVAIDLADFAASDLMTETLSLALKANSDLQDEKQNNKSQLIDAKAEIERLNALNADLAQQSDTRLNEIVRLQTLINGE